MTDLETLRAQQIEASVARKILTRLTPFLALLYTFNILDRNNLSIAALTMKDALKFNDAVYGLGAGMFFVGYFFFEVPSNLIMERVGARRWIARIMLTWGLISTSMMFVHTPASFYAIRCLLGVAEAGFYPGIILYLTYWVPGNARAQVISRFLALTSVIGLFGGPLGGALLKLNGFGHLAGWQWLFLLEGLPSILLSFVVLIYMPDGPKQATWLTGEEKTWITERLALEADEHRGVKHLSFRVLFTDSRIGMMCLIFFVSSTAGNAVGFFGPQLLKARSGGAWSDSFVASIGIIPALVGAIAMLMAARHSDRTGRRRTHVMLGYLVAACGFLFCVYAPSAWWVVGGLALNALGERIAAGSYWALTSTLMGTRAAAGGIALINSVGNLGGFFGPTLMGELKRQAHGNYGPGLYAATALFLAAALLPLLLRPQGAPQAGKKSEEQG